MIKMQLFPFSGEMFTLIMIISLIALLWILYRMVKEE